MKIGVVSDTHGNVEQLNKIIANNPDISLWLHAGDGAEDCLQAQELFSDKRFFFVRGNGDRNSQIPYELWLEESSLLIWLTHGHRENVKKDFHELIWVAKKGEADVVIFGHTHCPYIKKDENLWIVNPGAVKTSENFAIMEIEDGSVLNVESF